MNTTIVIIGGIGATLARSNVTSLRQVAVLFKVNGVSLIALVYGRKEMLE
jgi:hypothetical protein